MSEPKPLYVPLRPDAAERLRELALRERRSTRQQAALLLERALALDVRPPPSPEGLDAATRNVVDRLIDLDHFATWSALNRPEVEPLKEALAEYRRRRAAESG